ncbi:hypothetical protein TSUD_294220 [Trifolium subterraneum]|uniref:Uncharacterized protein n=1 Tax=Trifolium subterraneum TaxID=3900 RepID=A0A2Z6M3I6_TRISU|nr:hypothetical protein TSUD_294220 [Trifolium subterraneum]
MVLSFMNSPLSAYESSHQQYMASLRSMQDQLGNVSQLSTEMMVESEESNDVALSDSDECHPFTKQIDLPAVHDETPFCDGNFLLSDNSNQSSIHHIIKFCYGVQRYSTAVGATFTRKENDLTLSQDGTKSTIDSAAIKRIAILLPPPKPPDCSFPKKHVEFQLMWDATMAPPSPEPPDVSRRAVICYV